MAITGSGEIQLTDIYDEFTGTHSSQEIQLSDYHGSGNAPSSGEIQLAADFYGTSAGDWKGSRAFYFGGWYYSSSGSGLGSDHIQYKTMTTDGDMGDFGDLSISDVSHFLGSGSNGTRVLRGGGIPSGGAPSVWATARETIDYWTAASTVNASDAGDLEVPGEKGGASGASNGTLCLFIKYDIQYQNISSTGGATDGGGGLYGGATSQLHEASNGDTYTLICGINDAQYGAANDAIHQHNFSTSANATDFGNVVTVGVGGGTGCCSSTTRVVLGGGWVDSSYTRSDVIHYLTIASPSDSTDAMDLNQALSDLVATSDGTRGEFYGGRANVGFIQNDISKITIASLSGTSSIIGDLANEDSGSSGGNYTETGGVFNGGAQTAILG